MTNKRSDGVSWIHVVMFLVCGTSCLEVCAVHSESPEVKTLRRRGLEFLKGKDHEALGGKCLLGLVFFKEYKKKDQPAILNAVQACQAEIQSSGPSTADNQEYNGTASGMRNQECNSIYNTAIAVIFLLEVDAKAYRSEIQYFLDGLKVWQRSDGGWGQPDRQDADTSMSQYATLALWLAQDKGYTVSPQRAAAACNWFLRTQDPSGAWGYQGYQRALPEGGQFERINQTEIRHSMVAAGLGSVYILTDLLNLVPDKKEKPKNNLPAALRVAAEPKKQKKRGPALTGNINRGILQRALNDGDAWFANYLKFSDTEYTHYYMYALERCMSFREEVYNIDEAEPKWYNDGYQFLAKTQADNGSWQSDLDVEIDTSLAILFLQRSTKMSLGAKSSYKGSLISNSRLPRDTSFLEVKNGKFVTQRKKGLTDDIFKWIDESDGTDVDWNGDMLVEVELSDNPKERTAEIVKLERFLRAGKYQVRRVAVDTLAGLRDLDRIPALIYALSDKDTEVRRCARDGLRFISRKFGGFGLSDDPAPVEIQAAITDWKTWYLSIVPSAEFWN